MANRRFVFSEGTSNKYWEVDVDGSRLTTHYGKIGTDGQTTLKTFGSPEEAAEQAAKLVAEKQRKGYVEQGAGAVAPAAAADRDASPYPDIIGAVDVPAAFRGHFAYLADSPGYEPVLAAIATCARAARMRGDDLVVELEEAELVATPPASKGAYEGWPDSFRRVVAHHEQLHFPELHSGLCLGDSGGIDFEIDELPTIREVMADHSDWWVVGTEKKGDGEPEISKLSHASEALAEATALNPGALFLKGVAELLELDVDLPEPARPAPSTGRVELLAEVAHVAELAAEDEEPRPSPIDGAAGWLAATRGRTLCLFDASRPEAPRLLGTCALPSAVDTSFGAVKFQRRGDTLYVGDGAGWMEVDVSDPADPKLRRSLRTDAKRCMHWFGDDEVVFHYYLNDEDAREERKRSGASPDEIRTYPLGDGVYRQPLGGGPAAIERIGDYLDYGQDSLQVGDRVLFLSQDGLESYAPEARTVSTAGRFSTYWARMADLAPHPLVAVLETDDGEGHAVRLFDVSGRKPKAGAKLFRRMDAKAWSLEGDRLWLVLQSRSRSGRAFGLGAVTLPGGAEEAPLPLPGELPWSDVTWIKVAGGRMAALFADGTVRRLILPAAGDSAHAAPESSSARSPTAGAAPAASPAPAPTAPSGRARRFVFAEGDSHKFWEIAVEGTSFTTRYGRIGSSGQSTTKSFDTAEAATQGAEKLVQEKVKKGYREE